LKLTDRQPEQAVKPVVRGCVPAEQGAFRSDTKEHEKILLFLSFFTKGININDYPAIRNHLNKFKNNYYKIKTGKGVDGKEKPGVIRGTAEVRR